MGVVLGLLAAVGFGAADLLARYATRRIGAYRALLFMQFFGLIALTIYLAVSSAERHRLSSAPHSVWAWTAITTGLEMVSGLALYRSYEIGVLSVVSPIAASFGAVAVALSLLSGERVNGLQGLGICLTVAGVVLASSHPPGPGVSSRPHFTRRPPAGVGWALVAALGYGTTFWLLGFRVTPYLGSVIPVWFIRLATPVVLLVFAAPLRQSAAIPRGTIWWLLAAVGILDTVAFLAASAALNIGPVAIAAVLVSLFSAVTVLLAWIILKEALARLQWLGVGGILLGVIFVNLRG